MRSTLFSHNPQEGHIHVTASTNDLMFNRSLTSSKLALLFGSNRASSKDPILYELVFLFISESQHNFLPQSLSKLSAAL